MVYMVLEWKKIMEFTNKFVLYVRLVKIIV